MVHKKVIKNKEPKVLVHEADLRAGIAAQLRKHPMIWIRDRDQGQENLDRMEKHQDLFVDQFDVLADHTLDDEEAAGNTLITVGYTLIAKYATVPLKGIAKVGKKKIEVTDTKSIPTGKYSLYRTSIYLGCFESLLEAMQAAESDRAHKLFVMLGL